MPSLISLPLSVIGLSMNCDSSFFKSQTQARFFLLVDLREFFFRSRVGGTKKKKKKSSENDQLTGHFQSFFFFFQSFFFFNISRKNSKTNKVNQQSVLNL